MQHFINAFKLYGVFSGRSTREEYWMFTLIYLLAYGALIMVSSILESNAFEIVVALLSLGVVVPSLSITARRLHDTGRSGWWQVSPYIGFVFAVIGILQESSVLSIGGSILILVLAIMLLVFLISPSQENNQYGSKPNI